MNQDIKRGYEYFDSDTIKAINEFCGITVYSDDISYKNNYCNIDTSNMSISELINYLSKRINISSDKNTLKQKFNLRLKSLLYYIETKNIPSQYYDVINTLIRIDFIKKDAATLQILKNLFNNIERFCEIINKYNIDICIERRDRKYSVASRYIEEISDTAWNYDIDSITKDIDMEYFCDNKILLSSNDAAHILNVKLNKIENISMHKSFLNIIIIALNENCLFNTINKIRFDTYNNLNKNDFCDIKRIIYNTCIYIYLLKNMQIRIKNTEDILFKLIDSIKSQGDISIQIINKDLINFITNQNDKLKTVGLCTNIHSEYFVIIHDKEKIYIPKRYYIDILKDKMTYQVDIVHYLKNEIENILKS